jgi:hypothetical protein
VVNEVGTITPCTPKRARVYSHAMKVPAPHRWLAATTLAAVIACLLAATGLLAPCHQGEAPMSCCPDSSQASSAGPQAALIAPAVLTAQSATLQPLAAMAAAPITAAPLLAPQRDVYLRLSSLLI